MSTFHPAKLISGGQTGADRAGLDVALILAIPHGGWCPAGRRAADGRIPERYLLTETKSASYVRRTKLNVRESDATLILALSPDLVGGSVRTESLARAMGKPILILTPLTPDPVSTLRHWLNHHRPNILNVAGSSEERAPGTYAFAHSMLIAALSKGALPA